MLKVTVGMGPTEAVVREKASKMWGYHNHPFSINVLHRRSPNAASLIHEAWSFFVSQCDPPLWHTEVPREFRADQSDPEGRKMWFGYECCNSRKEHVRVLGVWDGACWTIECTPTGRSCWSSDNQRREEQT